MFKVECPHCHQTLSDPNRIIGGIPGIRVKIKVGEKEGEIWISSKFGDLQIDSGEIEIISGEVVEFFCPHCNEKISNGGTGSCDSCQAPMVSLVVVMETLVCSRRGCTGHKMSGNIGPYEPLVSGF